MSFVVHRVAKSAARYTDAGGREKCAYCRFFMAPRACGKVIGPVSPQGWCKYFSRQVAQQYSGAGITGGGGPPGMTLDLNFMSSGNMPVGVSFTRASSATYTDASGVVQTAATNAPRWDYAGGVLRGLLIEEARTNIALWSTNFTNAVWGLFNGATPGAAVTGPDGTATGRTLNFAAQVNSQIYQAVAGPAVAVFSVWARSNTVTSFQLRTALGAQGTFTLTPVWQRFSLAIDASSGNFAIQNVGSAAGSIDIAMPQVEQGAFPTSYIPTTSVSVTRAADVATMPVDVSWYSPTATTLVAEAILSAADSAGAGNFAQFDDGTTANRITLYSASGLLLSAFASSGGTQILLNATLATTTANTVFKLGLAMTAGRQAQSANGLPVVVTTSGLHPSGITLLRLGSSTNGVSGTLRSGYIRRVTYWNRALSDTEMQQVTT